MYAQDAHSQQETDSPVAQTTRKMLSDPVARAILGKPLSACSCVMRLSTGARAASGPSQPNLAPQVPLASRDHP